MNNFQLDFTKGNGLIPAVVQDADTREVLMLGFMNEAALKATLDSGKVTFWSRSKERLWMKGETSGHVLIVVEIKQDCDNDTLLITARSIGPTCHTGMRSCFGDGRRGIGFMKVLETLIDSRQSERPKDSYTSSLFDEGLDQIVAKVREESDEVIVAACAETRERLIEESADLIFRWLVLLAFKKITLEEVVTCLEDRNLR